MVRAGWQEAAGSPGGRGGGIRVLEGGHKGAVHGGGQRGPLAGGCRVQRSRKKERSSKGKGRGRSRRCPAQDTRELPTSNL